MTPTERSRALWRIGLTFVCGMVVWLVATYALGPAGWLADLLAIPLGLGAAVLCWVLTRRTLGGEAPRAR